MRAAVREISQCEGCSDNLPRDVIGIFQRVTFRDVGMDGAQVLACTCRKPHGKGDQARVASTPYSCMMSSIGTVSPASISLSAWARILSSA